MVGPVAKVDDEPPAVRRHQLVGADTAGLVPVEHDALPGQLGLVVGNQAHGLRFVEAGDAKRGLRRRHVGHHVRRVAAKAS